MSQVTEIQVGEYTWLHSWRTDEVEDAGEDDGICVTCGGIVHDPGDEHWICAENGEVVHVGCPFPYWD